MSMLVRKGTMVRKNRGSLKRGSGRRMHSSSSTGISTGSTKSTGSYGSYKGSSKPVAAIKAENASQSSPSRSLASTVVSFDDQRELCKTTLDWSSRGKSVDTEQGNYGAIFIQIQEAKAEATGACDFICRSGRLICHTAFITVLVGISTALPITMLSVGVKYLNECPRQRKIPVYLLVGGCFGMVKIIGTVWHNIQSKRYEELDSFYDAHEGDGAFASRTFRMMDVMLTTFLFAWLVAGTFWVFDIWEPHYQQLLHEPSNWCDRTVYLFAAYQIIASYAFICVLILIMASLALCFKCKHMCHRR
ncbi:transmembrane protein 272-like [Ylistrum balloti]|uniref:transmembrane protein 272-like n=1 Tax=Ylistrum balloti TaxID=509963 RepID=UPI002905AB3B|nr:transmembrane protein 272-like [Ylistrum balloti]